jgi:adenylate cyclase
MVLKRLSFGVGAVGLTGLLLWLQAIQFLAKVDVRLQDSLLLTRQPSAQIVLVTIDNDSIQELGVWPFPRSLHAELIETIAADEPKVIGYDVTFSEVSSLGEDQRLAEALRLAGPVVLASEAVLEIRPEFAPLSVSTLEPLAVFQVGEVKFGPTTLIPDADGVIRQAPLVYSTTGKDTEKSFAQLLAEVATPELTLGEQPILHVPYVGGPGTFTGVSMAEVLKGDLPEKFFADKIVLVGATAADLHDEYLTPMGGGQATAGVLDGGQIRLVLIILAVISLCLCLSLRLRISAVALASLAVAYLLGAVALSGVDILLPVLYPLALISMLFGIDVLYRYRDEHTRRRFIQTAFGRYVSPAVVAKLASGEAPLALGGTKQELTILFSDIRGFTTLSEQLPPEELVTFLNEYLSGMTDLVLHHEGTVDKYIGDAVMAFWGAPLPQNDHAVRGVLSALAMQSRLAELNQAWRAAGKPTIEIGVGLNTGRVIVGNMGSERRFDYTIIGDDVNLASRLESLTKYYGVGVLISEATKNQLGDKFLLRPLDRVAVKGKKDAVKIFEVVSLTTQATEEQLAWVARFESALKAYYRRDWAGAEKMFREFGADKTSQVFIERCQKYASDEPTPDWDGTFIAKDK